MNKIFIPKPWVKGEKIPWDNPDFSKRMLKEHLSQEHNLASRKFDIIEEQVEWINNKFLKRTSSNILELGCGPGLYLQKLSQLGHRCSGIDFSPASIEYAKSNANSEGLKIHYKLGDIRKVEFGFGFDLIFLIFGEFNTFKRQDAKLILQKTWNALNSGGLILLEPHLFDAIKKEGLSSGYRKSLKKGIFSDSPYEYFEERYWDSVECAFTRCIHIKEDYTDVVNKNYSSMQAYTEQDYHLLMSDFGFSGIQKFSSLTGNNNKIHEGLFVLTANKIN